MGFILSTTSYLLSPTSSYSVSCPARKYFLYWTIVWDSHTGFLCFGLAFLFDTPLHHSITALPLHGGACPEALPENGGENVQLCGSAFDSALLPASNDVCPQALTKGWAAGEREQNQLLQMERTEWTRAGVSPLGSNGSNTGSEALSTDPRILLVREVLSV